MNKCFLGLAALSLPSMAHAFCGTYVGQPGAELYAHTSQVLMVREGQRTTLTLTNDYEGEVTDFAMLIPVPQVLDEDDVSLAPADIIQRMAEYTGPRLVEYECSDFMWGDEYWEDQQTNSGGCSSDDMDVDDADFGSAPAPPALQVDVENSFAVGAYEFVVLSSDKAIDLVKWLDNEGYGVDAEAEQMLGEYIEDGSFFLAAKVNLDEVPAAGDLLPPIRIAYDSPSMGLPIRLGTLNSTGSQDLIVYTVTHSSEGKVGIANYPEVTVASECMPVDVGPENIAEHVLDAFGTEVEAKGGAAWSFDYGWVATKCDPCPPGGAISEADLARTGFEGAYTNAYVSRLRVRYTPDTALEDLAMYTSGDQGQAQLRYIVYKPELEGEFDLCTGERGDGTCDNATNRTRAAGMPWLPVSLFTLLTGLGWAVRRRFIR